MDTKSASIDDIREIRRLMEKSSRFLSLSGLSGIFAGIFALLGAGAAYLVLDKGNLIYDEPLQFINTTGDVNLIRFLLTDAFIVLCLALAAGYYFSVRRARKMEVKFWNSAAKRMILNLFIPLVTGGVVIIIFILRSQMNYLAPFSLIFYGLGLVNAGKYSYADINYLGIVEILLGILSFAFHKSWFIILDHRFRLVPYYLRPHLIF